MSMSYDGPSPCVKCGSNWISKDVCENCGTNQTEYAREKQIKNLLKYGFTKNPIYDKPTFIQKLFGLTPKIINYNYNYKDYVIAEFTENEWSANMWFYIGDEKKVLNSHGDYKYVKKAIDRLINTKEIQREIKLRELLGDN